MKAEIDATNSFVFKDKKEKTIVFVDIEWKNKFESGMTSVKDLILDFANRFSFMLFTKTDKEVKVTNKKKIIQVLYKQLKHHETKLSHGYDSYLGSVEQRSLKSGEFSIRNGRNLVFAKADGIVYKIGEGSKRTIIIGPDIANPGSYSIIGGRPSVAGKSRHFIVISARSRAPIKILDLSAPYELIIKRTKIQDLMASVDGSCLTLKSSVQENMNTLIKIWCAPENCQQLTTLVSGKTQTILNFKIDFFIKNPEKQVIISWDDVTKTTKLRLPFAAEDSVLNIGYERNDLIGNSAWIYFTAKGGSSFAKWNSNYKLPYFTFPFTAPETDKSFWVPNMGVVIKLLQGFFKAGIEFETESSIKTGVQIRSFVVEMIRDGRFEFHGFPAAAQYRKAWKTASSSVRL